MRRVSLLSLTLALASAAHASQAPDGKLPRTVVPTHYTLTLELDPAAEGFAGEVRIQARSAEPLRTIHLHGKDLEIVSASATAAGGQAIALRATPAHESGVLALTAERPLPAGRPSGSVPPSARITRRRASGAPPVDRKLRGTARRFSVDSDPTKV